MGNAPDEEKSYRRQGIKGGGYMNAGIWELDLHGKNVLQAKQEGDAALKKADSSVYRLRISHGFHGGKGIRSMLQEEYSYGREPKVIRIQGGVNPGITELVLRDY